jgi:RNA polymerase sigma-70 factor, ECF subfamily
MAGEVVETCLSRAHQFRGSCPAELFAWADQILVRKLKNLLRKMQRRGKRVSLTEYLERSRERIENLLVATQTSPGARLVREESSFRLLCAIERLSADEKDAIVLHYFHDWPIAKVAERMDRTAEAASGLLYRSLKKLRERLAGGKK